MGSVLISELCTFKVIDFLKKAGVEEDIIQTFLKEKVSLQTQSTFQDNLLINRLMLDVFKFP